MKLQPTHTANIKVAEPSKAKKSRPSAKAIVRAINIHVEALTKNSTLIGRGTHDATTSNTDESDDAFGLFERHELTLGKCLGSGGFSEVHEIVTFEPKQPVNMCQDYSSDEVEARRHYQVSATKQDGKPKYVIKHLRRKITEESKEFALAAADLAVEARFLSNLNHKNILKIRGLSSTGIESYLDRKHDGYFLILDRLHETLDQRIAAWSDERHVSTFEALGIIHHSHTIDNTTSQLLRATRVAHQMASALEYLHSKNLVFRDLKPDNVGFDENGVVKIFDFGLARELPEITDNAIDVYEMSGKMGTIRYMAPEVALCKPYNRKVDTYSWATVFWNCLALEKPYHDLTRTMHREMICKKGVRPTLVGIPEDIGRLLSQAWDQKILTRLTMTQVCSQLERIEQGLVQEIKQQPIPVAKKSVASRILPSFAKRRARKLQAAKAKQTLASVAA
jgi:serine/threonine protein kinase